MTDNPTVSTIRWISAATAVAAATVSLSYYVSIWFLALGLPSLATLVIIGLNATLTPPEAFRAVTRDHHKAPSWYDYQVTTVDDHPSKSRSSTGAHNRTWTSLVNATNQ